MPPNAQALRPQLRIRLHVRVLADPVYFTVAEMIEAMRAAFRQARMEVDVVSNATLFAPALQDLEIGPCVPGVLTLPQAALFANRAGMESGDVAVYFVRSTIPRSRGCAAHPERRPGAVLTRLASRWTLAHEVGHVLGLGHTSDTRRLMTSRDTARIPVPLPRLTRDEIEVMRASRWVHQP